MNLLHWLGVSRKRTPWQELVGLRPHMIEQTAVDAGFGKRKWSLFGLPMEDPEDEGPEYEIRNGVAIIDVRGVLVNDEDYWDGYGCATYDCLTENVMQAVADPAVNGIVLSINSPGGECDKAFETAARIVEASKKKPVWCVADTSAYSAGYLLACSGSRLYVPPFTGGVGSIGVYSLHLDMSQMLENAGVVPTFLEAGTGKTDGHPYKPLSPEAKKRMQANVDRLYGLFVDHVAAQRQIPAGTIREMGAQLYDGNSGIEAGLADMTGDTDQAAEQMATFLQAKIQVAVASAVQAEAVVQAPDAVLTIENGVVTEIASSVDAASVATVEDIAAAVGLPAHEVAADMDETVYASAPAAIEDPVAIAREEIANRDGILALCAVSGLSAEKAQEFIKAGKKLADVQASIAAERAERSEESEIVSQLQPTTAASLAANPNESPIVRAAEKLAQKER